MNEPEVAALFRPVGERELDLIRDAGGKRFPPRLAGQPIFYPVLTEEYAVKIARDWNTKDPHSGFVGYVVRFQIRQTYLDRYQPQSAGGQSHLEYWIPAADLENFNDNIIGPIEVIHTFRAPGEP